MNQKKFLLTFEYDERTRFVVDDVALTEVLQTVLATVGKSQCLGRAPWVSVLHGSSDAVLVCADALLKLQSKATTLQWITDNPEVFTTILNNHKVPPEVAYKMGEVFGDWIKEGK